MNFHDTMQSNDLKLYKIKYDYFYEHAEVNCYNGEKKKFFCKFYLVS